MVKVRGFNRYVDSLFGGACITGRTVNALDSRRLCQFPYQGVLAAALADDQNFHATHSMVGRPGEFRIDPCRNPPLPGILDEDCSFLLMTLIGFAISNERAGRTADVRPTFPLGCLVCKSLPA